MTTHTRQARWPIAVAVLGFSGLLLATPASAQNIGTFQFALQPFCNQVSMTITQEGATYRLAGWDDACGANERYPLRGVIAGNADGTLHVVFTVTRPNGISVETSVRNFNVGSLSGNWTDSAGNSGTFPLGGAPGGSGARPGPTSTVPTNSVTTVNIVDGSIAAADVNPAQVQLRVSGTCPSGQAVASVNQDGTVNCVSAGATTTAPFTAAVENTPIGGTLDTTCRATAALPLTIPAAGSLSCTAVQHAILNHTNGPDPSRITAEIDLTAASCPDGLLAGAYEIPAQLASFNGQNASVPVQRRFDVAAGAMTVYLNTQLWNATTGLQQGNALSCTFTPQ